MSAYIKILVHRWAEDMLDVQKLFDWYSKDPEALDRQLKVMEVFRYFDVAKNANFLNPNFLSDLEKDAIKEIVAEIKLHPYWEVLRHSLSSSYGIEFNKWLEPIYLGDFVESEG